MSRVVEVFADVGCPFAHVGLRRLVERRGSLGPGADFTIRVKAWPLELVNGRPLDADFVIEETRDLRDQVAPDLFAGSTAATFPSSFLPAMALTAAAAAVGPAAAEGVALDLRTALFEHGLDPCAPEVLREVAARHDVTPPAAGDHAAVLAEYEEGRARGVVGSPHFFVGDEGFFCPALDIRRDDAGRLRVRADADALDRLVDRCVGTDRR